MRTGTRFTVSVQILTLVATEQGVGLTSNSLAELMGSNSVMVRQLFGKLRLAGLLKISAGKGPLSLAASPRKITLWDGFVAVEDDVRDLISFRPKLPEAPALSFKKIMVVHAVAAVLGIKKALQKVAFVRELKTALRAKRSSFRNFRSIRFFGVQSGWGAGRARLYRGLGTPQARRADPRGREPARRKVHRADFSSPCSAGGCCASEFALRQPPSGPRLRKSSPGI